MAKRKAAPIRAIAIFVVLVVISGFILAATGNFDNPVTEISDAITYGNLIQEPPDVAVDGGNALPMDTVTTTPKGMDWSQAGGVLFDIWFFCAVTAVVIVLQQGISWGIRVIRNRQIRRLISP